MERPRIFLDTKQTNSTTMQDLLAVQISNDARGVSYLTLMLDPDPAALYEIRIARLINKNDVEIPKLWVLELPHLTSGVYEGLQAGDSIILRHKTTDGGVTVKSAVSLEFNEVVCG